MALPTSDWARLSCDGRDWKQLVKYLAGRATHIWLKAGWQEPVGLARGGMGF